MKKTIHKAKSFLKRCTKKLSGSVGVLEAHKLCGKIVKRKKARVKKRRTAIRRAAHAGPFYTLYYEARRQVGPGRPPKSYEGPFSSRAAAAEARRKEIKRYNLGSGERIIIVKEPEWNRRWWGHTVRRPGEM